MKMDAYLSNQHPEAPDLAETALTNAPESADRPDATLHEYYVRAINSALQAGSASVAVALTAACRDEARRDMRKAA
jgi:hypothetical protein